VSKNTNLQCAYQIDPGSFFFCVVDKKGVDKDGQEKKRMVIDFRTLNQKTENDSYPIPTISEILSNMAQYLLTLDPES